LVVSDATDGELRLASTLEDYFDATPSVATWSWGTWNDTTFTPSPAAGILPVTSTGGSAWLRSNSTFSNAAVEGVVSFGNGAWQHFGFADDSFGGRFAIVSTADGTGVYARTWMGASEERTLLPGVSLGAYHLVRVEWTPTAVNYYVDGSLAATHNVTLTGPMYVYLSNNSSAPLSAQWVRVDSYPQTKGVYTSCTKDAGATFDWSQLQWKGQAPTGTSVAFQTRTSDDASTWSSWADVSSGGRIVSPSGRFLQYRVTLAGTASASPQVEQVVVGTAAVSTPTPTPSPTSTLMPTATSTAIPNSTRLKDTTVTDFAASGVPTGLVVSDATDGELRLASSAEDYFDTTPSSATWSWGTWNDTTFTPSPAAGVLPVTSAGGSAWLRSNSTLSNAAVEGVVSFGNGAWQHFGFADDSFGSRFAMLSTADGSGLYARTFAGASEERTLLTDVSLGAYHLVRIEWTPTTVNYYVDGSLVATHNVTFAGPMYVYLSNNSSAPLSAQWVRVDSYPLTSAVYTSCIKDAGAPINWGQLQWEGRTPTGTSLTFQTRTSSDTSNWSAWTNVAADGHIASPVAPYLQYRVTLTGTSSASPEVSQVAVGPAAVSTPTPIPTPTSTATATVPPTPSPTATPMPPTVLVGDDVVESNADSADPGWAEAFVYTANASGTVTRLSVFLASNNEATKVMLGLYSNAAGNKPGTLLTSGTIASPVAGIWNSVGVSSASVTGGTTYWLALMSPTGAGTVRFFDGSESSAQASSQTTLTTLPSTWSSGESWTNSPASIYAVHDASSSVPPSISGVAGLNVSDSGVTLVWTTDVAATSQVDYGTTTSYGTTTPLDTALIVNHSVTLNNLTASRTYHYRVRSTSSSGVTAVSKDYTFDTPAVTPATNPILLVVDPASPNKFGAYLGEILRAEGINGFQTIAPANVSTTYLASFPTVILAQTSPLTLSQVSMYSNYVSAGGTLIAMRPDPQLAAVFGLSPDSGTVSDGYLLVNSANPISLGISNQTLQFHGVADRYTLNGASSLATLYTDATTATSAPAVVTSTFGSGRAAAYTFDLASSVVYTRQGNPATAGTPDQNGVPRSTQAFINGWVNLDRVGVPQADEQQRLLANVIVSFAQQTTPIPRAWYFPSADQASVLIPTGDEHSQIDAHFQNMIDAVVPFGGRMTFYMSHWGQATSASVQAWHNQGHEFGIHPYGYADSVPLSQGVPFAINWFTPFYGFSPSKTVRTHQVEWQGWTDAAAVEQANGLAMDTSFYAWGPWLRKPNGQWVCTGYPNGSGLPMKFVDQSGTLISVYQQVTEAVDEQMITEAGAGYCGLSDASATTATQQLIDQALGGYYSAVTLQAHVDYQKTTWLSNVAAYAQSKGVPIWTAQRWLSFTQARHDAIVDQFNWNAATHRLTFRYTSSTSEPSSTILVPSAWQSRSITSATVDGVAVTPASLTAKGIAYAGVSVASGTHTVVVQYAP
jgi:hypothetical protein